MILFPENKSKEAIKAHTDYLVAMNRIDRHSFEIRQLNSRIERVDIAGFPCQPFIAD